MTENGNNQSKGLAIASFVLALAWWVLCLTIIGAVLWIICWVLAFIFGIVALCKKQDAKRASIIWIILSVCWVAIFSVVSLFTGKLIAENKDQILSPITEFSAWIEENPEIAALMEDEEFKDQFEAALEQRLKDKYGEDYENVEDLEWVLGVWEDLFEEMKNIATELAAQEWINAIVPVDIEETTAEVHECGDFYKTEEDIVCTEQYEPVCGDNGQTYGNSCFACIEVNSYKDWECVETTPAPAAKLMVQEWQTEEETQAMIQETCTNAWGQLVDGNCVLENGSVIAF